MKLQSHAMFPWSCIFRVFPRFCVITLTPSLFSFQLLLCCGLLLLVLQTTAGLPHLKFLFYLNPLLSWVSILSACPITYPSILKWCLIACLHFLTTVFSLIPFSLSTPSGLLRTGQLWTSLIQSRQESEPTQQWVAHIHHPHCATKTALLKGRRGRKQGKTLHVVFRSKSVRVTNLILKTGC